MRWRVLRTKLLPLHPPPPHLPYQMRESKPPVTKKIHLLPMTAHPTPKQKHGTLYVWSACACIPRTRTSASSLSRRRTWIVSHLLGRDEAEGLRNGAQTRHLSLLAYVQHKQSARITTKYRTQFHVAINIAYV